MNVKREQGVLFLNGFNAVILHSQIGCDQITSCCTAKDVLYFMTKQGNKLFTEDLLGTQRHARSCKRLDSCPQETFQIVDSLTEGSQKQILQVLPITTTLGIYFTLLQVSEYFQAPFTISDGLYGSTLFIATGFHGLHIIIVSTFLFICLPCQLKFQPLPWLCIQPPPWLWSRCLILTLRRCNMTILLCASIY